MLLVPVPVLVLVWSQFYLGAFWEPAYISTGLRTEHYIAKVWVYFRQNVTQFWSWFCLLKYSIKYSASVRQSGLSKLSTKKHCCWWMQLIFFFCPCSLCSCCTIKLIQTWRNWKALKRLRSEKRAKDDELCNASGEANACFQWTEKEIGLNWNHMVSRYRRGLLKRIMAE